MRERNLLDVFIIALNIILISIIITSRLFFRSFFNRFRISFSRLLISVAVSSDIRLFSVFISDEIYIGRTERSIRFILIKIILAWHSRPESYYIRKNMSVVSAKLIKMEYFISWSAICLNIYIIEVIVSGSKEWKMKFLNVNSFWSHGRIDDWAKSKGASEAARRRTWPHNYGGRA
jgi:hypothetical protein